MPTTGPSRSRYLIGRSLSWAVSRAPAAWPLLRGPTRRFWERSAGSWDERIAPDSEQHLAPLIAACERLDGAPARILELGTGTGAGARWLAQRYPQAQVDAVDLTEPMIEAARRRLDGELSGRVRLHVADAAQLPFDPASFDLVAQLNLPVYFASIARVLAPGGHVAVASSIGPRTPYYTPPRVLTRGFRRHRVHVVGEGSAGPGTYWIGARIGARDPADIEHPVTMLASHGGDGTSRARSRRASWRRSAR